MFLSLVVRSVWLALLNQSPDFLICDSFYFPLVVFVFLVSFRIAVKDRVLDGGALGFP